MIKERQKKEDLSRFSSSSAESFLNLEQKISEMNQTKLNKSYPSPNLSLQNTTYSPFQEPVKINNFENEIEEDYEEEDVLDDSINDPVYGMNKRSFEEYKLNQKKLTLDVEEDVSNYINDFDSGINIKSGEGYFLYPGSQDKRFAILVIKKMNAKVSIINPVNNFQKLNT